MAGSDPLERIEEHMRRGNELMELIGEEHRLNRAAVHEARDAIRAMVAALNGTAEETVASLAGMRAEMREESLAMRAEIADSREQIRANTRAVLAVLDELRGGGPGPSNAAA